MNSAKTTFLFLSLATMGAAQTSPGIAIDDPLTIRKCGGCHQRDSAGMMKRISYMRTSPEVWEQAIKRMIRLNGLAVTPAEVREILKFLSGNNGLAPEEMKPGFWEVEHRTTGYQDDHTPDAALQRTCNSCHSIGRVLSQRRTRDDYEKLVAMHIGLFPGSANTFRPQKTKAVSAVNAPARPSSNPQAGIVMDYPRATAVSPDMRYPVDLALEYLAKHQPLITPEWTAWRATMRPARLAGTWVVHGYQPGMGKIFGKVEITAGTAPDEFQSTVEFTYLKSGETVHTTGKGILYTGYNWRGRTGPAPDTTPAVTASVKPAGWREAMMLSRDGNHLDGRWFWSGFGELGIDVHLTRVGAEPLVVSTDVSALAIGSTATVKLYGANLPAKPQPLDIDFGRGVKVVRILSAAPGQMSVELSIDPLAPVGLRDVVIGRSIAKEAISIYDRIAYIEVAPDASIARLGGVKYPKEYAQFEAIAWAAGPDGKPQTEDDVYIGAVPARWSLEEFTATPTDDDTRYVGTLNDSGFFTPNIEGINPARKLQANNHASNNFGDVWVVAAFKAPDGRELKSKAYLVVTIPNYTLYDQPEVVQ